MQGSVRFVIAAGLITASLGGSGCGHPIDSILLPGGAPEVHLERFQLAPPTPDSYAVLARWTARTTGRPVSHYLCAIDPVSVEAVDGTWQRTSATRMVLTFPNAGSGAPREPHVFVVRAVDDEGRMSAPAWFAVTGSGGPLLTMYNDVFNYTYPSGGWLNDGSRHVTVEMPAGQPITLNWLATPTAGSDIHWYRWVLGPVDLLDETPRVDEAIDLRRWSQRSPTATSATIGPFSPPAGRVLTQFFFIEAQDTNGLRSLGIVNLVIRGPSSPGGSERGAF
jgi:hypothetical protein